MLAWPVILCPTSGGFAPFVRSLSGGQSLSGIEQIQPQLHDRWQAAFSFHISGKERIFTLRSMLTQLRGRAGSILVPTFENSRAPLSAATPGSPIGTAVVNPAFWQRWPEVAGTAYEYTALPGVTGTATIVSAVRLSFAATGDAPEVGMAVTLSGVKRLIEHVSGAGPYHCIFGPPLTISAETAGSVAATVNANAALNATTIDVHVSVGSAPLPGNYFSLGNRLYSIDTVTVLGTSTYRLGIWPWLRAAATAAATVNFSAPACEMRLASDAEGAEALRSLTQRRHGEATLRFDEVA